MIQIKNAKELDGTKYRVSGRYPHCYKLISSRLFPIVHRKIIKSGRTAIILRPYSTKTPASGKVDYTREVLIVCKSYYLCRLRLFKIDVFDSMRTVGIGTGINDTIKLKIFGCLSIRHRNLS